ncbi:MAG: hypothetical protein GXX91_06925 [Verrucomicrobiaceae bacterium]|nr:hypothetical protein [Verrucomicrobiaceae bacterium]
MKQIDRNAFYLIPATALTVVCFLGITHALSPATLAGLSETSNRASFCAYLVLTLIACGSGLGLLFRIRAAYPVSVVATVSLLGLAIYQLVGFLQRAPKMAQNVSDTLLASSAVHIFVLLVILILLSLGSTRERCFPPQLKHAGDGEPDPVST